MPISTFTRRVRTAYETIRELWLRALIFVTRPIVLRLLPDPYTEAGNVRVASKPTHASRVTMTEIIAAHHCNVKGQANAGTILGWIDIAAGISAKRHASAPSVTRSVDDVAFLHPIKMGDILTIQASVNKSWKTSMEVGVKVEAETPLTGERYFVAHAYLTFVALSPRPKPRTYLGQIMMEHNPIRVPEIVPYAELEKKRYDMAEQRRQSRFKKKQQDDLSDIRELMRTWSQGLQERGSEVNAEIRQHPALAATSPRTTDDERLTKKRRYSTDPRLVPSVSEVPMETTFAEVVELVMPQHANTLSITFGGQIMAWMEACALASANRLSRAYLLTASIDTLQFITPTHVGDVVTIRSIVSRTYTSSMEVYVSVEAENLQTNETKFTNDAFFTITAVDEDNIPVRVPKVVPNTHAEMRLNEGGSERRERRLAQRVELINLMTPGHSTDPSSPTPL
ncbi:hypothetical protein VTP01DRAFT_7647 [Rhizomucor pusillus]|uniref:uncharacterized protein n=1 Tax=Rhizomucor pusillus TaxID=4840 RepID=UPI0037430630